MRAACNMVSIVEQTKDGVRLHIPPLSGSTEAVESFYSKHRAGLVREAKEHSYFDSPTLRSKLELECNMTGSVNPGLVFVSP